MKIKLSRETIEKVMVRAREATSRQMERVKRKVKYDETSAMVKERVERVRGRVESSRVERNRFLVLLVSGLIIFDYLVFCYHSDKSIFDIFPSFPVVDTRKVINVYLPDLDGKGILRERRSVPVLDDTEGFIRALFKIVVKGSDYENTSMLAPMDTYVRKVWIYGDTCVIDICLPVIPEEAKVIPGSEEAFRAALEKTIVENIPAVKRVILLEKGIPGKRIWEIGRSGQ